MRKKLFFLTVSFGLGLGFSLVASGAEKLRVAFTAVGVSQSPSWVTVEKGFWKKHGLDVELILLSGGARSVPALVAGNVQVLIGSDVGVVQAIAQGIDLTRLGVTNNFVRASLLTQPNIQSIGDLKGKVLGITRGRDASHARLVKILRDHGINPADEVNFLTIGEGPTARLNALKTGIIHAALVNPPLDLVGSKEGLRIRRPNSGRRNYGHTQLLETKP